MKSQIENDWNLAHIQWSQTWRASLITTAPAWLPRIEIILLKLGHKSAMSHSSIGLARNEWNLTFACEHSDDNKSYLKCSVILVVLDNISKVPWQVHWKSSNVINIVFIKWLTKPVASKTKRKKKLVMRKSWYTKGPADGSKYNSQTAQ